jgi:hypothetical protein
VAKNRKIYSGLGVLLLLAALGLFLARRPGRNGDPSRAGKSFTQEDALRPAASASARSGDRKREAAQKYWSAAKELPPAEKAAALAESPLILSFLKSDPERKTLRVGFRQEKEEEVEPDDYEVEVKLLGADGQKLGEENTSSAMWWTDQEDFANEGVPMFEVKSLNPVSVVELKLSYKGQAVEQRKYEVAER